MKLPYQQLEKHVTQQLAACYLISSDELLLVQEAMDLLRSTAQKNGFSERIRLFAESDPDWGKLLYAHLHNLSLFSTKRILEFDLRGAKFNQANSEILQTYANQPQPNTLLLMHTHKLDKKNEQSQWYKTVEKNGVVIPIWPIHHEQLPQWILQRAKKINLNLTAKAALWLAQQVEGNLFAAATEIEKLSLLQTHDTLDEQALEKIITEDARFDVFQLVDSLLIGNSKRALHILNNLFADGTEPTLVLWAITRELRILADISKQMQQGTALTVLFNKFQIWEKRQASMRAFLKRYSYEQCWEFLLIAAEIDRIIKGGTVGNVRDALEQLILSITGNGIMISGSCS